MSEVAFAALADRPVLHLTTLGRTSGQPREIEIWFIVYQAKFYLFAEHGEAAGWVKNLRRNPHVSVRFDERVWPATARVLDQAREPLLWQEVQAVAERKYEWGDGLPVEITVVA